MNIIRLVPKTRSPRPSVKGIHGDLAIRKDATIGATSSATTVAAFPSRKRLALEVSSAVCSDDKLGAYLLDSVVISEAVAKNIMAATASPPPMKRKNGHSQTRRTGRTSQNHITAKLQAPDTIMPLNESTKTNLRPILNR